ncbi:MAG: hypothetical protein ONB06_12075 [candidate division KSB1 bacterium]|nr:hypothetical protein [candidate division KSB1 bacterium]
MSMALSNVDRVVKTVEQAVQMRGPARMRLINELRLLLMGLSNDELLDVVERIDSLMGLNILLGAGVPLVVQSAIAQKQAELEKL